MTTTEKLNELRLRYILVANEYEGLSKKLKTATAKRRKKDCDRLIDEMDFYYRWMYDMDIQIKKVEDRLHEKGGEYKYVKVTALPIKDKH